MAGSPRGRRDVWRTGANRSSIVNLAKRLGERKNKSHGSPLFLRSATFLSKHASKRTEPCYCSCLTRSATSWMMGDCRQKLTPGLNRTTIGDIGDRDGPKIGGILGRSSPSRTGEGI